MEQAPRRNSARPPYKGGKRERGGFGFSKSRSGFSKPGFGADARKPFGAKPRFGSDRPKMRIATRIGEGAPRRQSPAGGFRKNTTAYKPSTGSFNKYKRPSAPSFKARPFAKPTAAKNPIKTGWGNVAQWYHDTVEGSSSYQRELILPNLLRLIDIQKGETVFDIACGEGFFSRAFATAGAQVVGADIAPELIALAKKQSPNITFHVASADKLSFAKDGSADKATIVLALQNIEAFQLAIAEAARVLKKGGSLFLVLNHPAFRIPQASSWGFDAEKGVQYRRLDAYMSESRVEIQMHPGDNPQEKTISFHRPLQVYVKALKKVGLYVNGLEEWTSHKKSEPGPRAEAENKARKEFPMFLLLEVKKL